MNIGNGQLNVKVNLNPHYHSFGCGVFIRNKILNIFGICLRLVMENESVMM